MLCLKKNVKYIPSLSLNASVPTPVPPTEFTVSFYVSYSET